MKAKKYLYMMILICLSSCYDENDFKPSSLIDVLNLKIENNNALANQNDKVKVIAEFPIDFNTEDDGKVRFIIYKNPVEEELVNIKLVEENGIDKRIAEVFISNDLPEPISVEAKITINESEVSKSTEINFSKAYPESLNLLTNSLTIPADGSFTEINITTELERDIGQVSTGTNVETKAVDISGNERGIFIDYKNTSDTSATVVNRFTMGNDNYTGTLLVISETLDANNIVIKDTLNIYSQN